MNALEMPKVAVIISLYNYGKYIIECINSVRAQCYEPLCIIVVNDGSSDDSLERLSGIGDICVISKPNGGQLSAFNAGFEALDDEEIVFFLDADDVMNPRYIAECVAIYKHNPSVDSVFCDSENLINGHSEPTISHYGYGKLGFGLYRSYYLRDYMGHSTSCISVRREILAKILPLGLEADWRIRADDCIIWGVALVGGSIWHLDFIGIKYRIHANNNHCGREFDNDYLYKREIAIARMFDALLDRNRIRFSRAGLYMEFLSNNLTLKYIKITLLSPFALMAKMSLIARIVRHAIVWRLQNRGGR